MNACTKQLSIMRESSRNSIERQVRRLSSSAEDDIPGSKARNLSQSLRALPLPLGYAVLEVIEMFYNPKRKHARNGMLSPAEFERHQKMRRKGV